ncbi:MAG: 4Fe-4S binding protein [Clostridia bacterium]
MEQYFVNMTVRALDAKAHPVLEKTRCINYRQGKIKCTKCAEVCPSGMLVTPEKGQIDWAKCVDCDLCAVVCPAKAFGLSGVHFQKAQALCKVGALQPIRTLGCDMSEVPLEFSGWCLGSIPWELICMLALDSQVELVRGKCDNCPNAAGLEPFERTLERTRLFLGSACFARQVRVTEACDATPPKLTRREALGAALWGIRRTVGASLGNLPAQNDGLLFRLLLVHKLSQPNAAGADSAISETGCGWQSPEFSEACWACGICAKICPNGAISVVERQGTRYLVHEPCLCTGCCACQAVCPEKAIVQISEKRLDRTARCVATRVLSESCTRCAGAVKPGTGPLCTRCRALKK